MIDLSVASGFVIGLVFGVVGLLSGFCLMSSLRDLWTTTDTRKIRSYATALAVAIAGTQLLAGTGIVNIGASLYLQPSFSAPLIFFGGLLFGLGMVLANGCASRALVLLGKGNLRSLVVITVIGITAQMTLKGLIAPARIAFLDWTKTAPTAVSAPALLSTMGLDDISARLIATLIASGALLIYAFSDKQFRRSYGQIAAGLIIGLLVVAGWAATGWFAADDFNPIAVSSLTFVSPMADSVQYTMLSTGLTLNFGIALVAGVLLGSLVTATLTGRFELEGYTSVTHTGRSLAGAAFMGIGGAMAYGCSIGQGLTGVSTLAMPSFIALAGILSGAAFAIRSKTRLLAFAFR
jgi:uncharacterized membrane protein YedE/YeeE